MTSLIVSVCDINYLSRYLVMRDSVTEKNILAKFMLITLDKESFQLVKNLRIERLEVISVDELMEHYPKVKLAKENRTRKEFIFSLTPYILEYGMNIYNPDVCIYLDSDVYLFRNPEDFIQENSADVGIVPHFFPSHLKHLERYGKYNVGFVYFKNSNNGRRVLNWWREKCSISTSTDISSGVFGDQKYLDSFENLGVCVEVILDIEIGRAPWNSYDCNRNSTKMFHFSGLERSTFCFISGHHAYRWRATRKTIKQIYRPYIEKLKLKERELSLNYVGLQKNLDLEKFKMLLMYLDFHWY